MLAKAPEKWKQNEDGTFSKGEITGVQVGDIVRYEEVLPDVTLTQNSQLIEDLAEYSGNTNSSYNTENTITQEKNLQWKVFDINKGKIRLISAEPTTSQIALYGADGYNNGVYLIDELCNTLYSSNKGKAKNIKIEDIENKLAYNYKQYKNTYVTPNIIYGETKEYTSYLKYPNIYSSEIGCKEISGNENLGNLSLSQQSREELIKGYSTAANSLKVTQTYWDDLFFSSDKFLNPIYHSLLIKKPGADNYIRYWLSSRGVFCQSNHIKFNIQMSGAAYSTNYKTLYTSFGGGEQFMYPTRPVVTLNSNIELSGNSTNGWDIQ